MYFLFNRTTLQVSVTYLTGALYVHPLCFYKYQHENRVRSKMFVACQQVAFSLPFPTILVNCAPSEEMHNYCTPHIIKENFENFLIHRYSHLKCIVYDKLLTPRQSFWITLYIHMYNSLSMCASRRTHTPQVQNMPPNTNHANDKYLWTITSNFSQSTGHHYLMMALCDPKYVGVIFNYVSFKLSYNIDFNIYVLYKWVH